MRARERADAAGLVELEARVRALLAARVGAAVVAGLTSDADFDRAGIDSVDLLAVVAQLERELAVEPARLEPLDRACCSIASTASYLRRSSRRSGGQGSP
jgi:acyl carrier protein